MTGQREGDPSMNPSEQVSSSSYCFDFLGIEITRNRRAKRNGKTTRALSDLQLRLLRVLKRKRLIGAEPKDIYESVWPEEYQELADKKLSQRLKKLITELNKKFEKADLGVEVNYIYRLDELFWQTIAYRLELLNKSDFKNAIQETIKNPVRLRRGRLLPFEFSIDQPQNQGKDGETYPSKELPTWPIEVPPGRTLSRAYLAETKDFTPAQWDVICVFIEGKHFSSARSIRKQEIILKAKGNLLDPDNQPEQSSQLPILDQHIRKIREGLEPIGLTLTSDNRGNWWLTNREDLDERFLYLP
jgi:DNA-binding winged helix-turn-helix (wHTH) protein